MTIFFQRKFLLLSLLIFSTLLPGSTAFAASDQKRDFNCFINELDRFSKSEFDTMFEKDMINKISTRVIDSDTHQLIRETGKKLYEAHKAKIDDLYREFTK